MIKDSIEKEYKTLEQKNLFMNIKDIIYYELD